MEVKDLLALLSFCDDFQQANVCAIAGFDGDIDMEVSVGIGLVVANSTTL